LQDLENKGDSLQNIQNARVMVCLELWETQARGWWILSLLLVIVAWVSSGRGGFAQLRRSNSATTASSELAFAVVTEAPAFSPDEMYTNLV
jgi:hypothetical protein